MAVAAVFLRRLLQERRQLVLHVQRLRVRAPKLRKKKRAIKINRERERERDKKKECSPSKNAYWNINVLYFLLNLTSRLRRRSSSR